LRNALPDLARCAGCIGPVVGCEAPPSGWDEALEAHAVDADVVDEAEPVSVPYRLPASSLVLNERGVSLHHCDWRQLAEVARDTGGVDAVIVDKPYSAKTHKGHDGGVSSADRMRNFATLTGGQEKDRRYALKKAASTGQHRRTLDYQAWTPEDVYEYVEAWAPLCRGWMVSMTDDVLFPHWRDAMAEAGRQVFQDIPAIIRGMSVRLTGDGPSSWSIHIAVSRPRTRAMASWGTLDGGYVGPSERQPVVGGKPEWLVRALVRDYTRPGDLVADSGCGGGTLGVACIAERRSALLGDCDEAHVAIAAERLRSLPAAPNRSGTLSLFGSSRS
jgi:hypothetical protein